MRSLRVLMLVAVVLISVFDRCAAAELRTVGNVQVDLQPLVDWSVKKKGERPLKHWKLVQVLELKKPSASPALLCDIEGLKTEIILKNCPGGLVDLLHQKADLDAKLAAARKNESAAAGNLGEARNKRQAKQAKRSHTSAAETEKTIKKDVAELDRKLKQQQKFFAMATGATFDGLPVWDTGLKSH